MVFTPNHFVKVNDTSLTYMVRVSVKYCEVQGIRIWQHCWNKDTSFNVKISNCD